VNAAIEIGLLVLVLVTALAVVGLRNLFAATILLGIYSLLMALSWTNMQAYDVAFTEAAVGAGISSILLIGALVFTGSKAHLREERTRLHYPSLAAAGLLGAALLYGTLDMPAIGDPKAPVHQGVARHYIDHSYAETHVPNMVTSVLASYRGYDTLFETAVIFTAGAALVLLLRPPAPGTPQPPPPPSPPSPQPAEPERKRTRSGRYGRYDRFDDEADCSLADQVVLTQTTKLLIPFIILYGVYVVTHGEIGPGGGFQGGVILASAYLLYALVFGTRRARASLPRRVTDVIGGLGVLLYAGVGIATMLMGGAFLEYNRLDPQHVQHGQELGMTLVEYGVALTVAAVMVTLFSEIAEAE
jgi:multicomponent Na+:H+ antiporter subunit B